MDRCEPEIHKEISEKAMDIKNNLESKEKNLKSSQNHLSPRKPQGGHFRIKNYKILSLILGITLILSLGGNVVLTKIALEKNSNNILDSLIKPASAKEIYDLFICPCCGDTIDTNCCQMAKERKAYVDSLIETKTSKDKVILAYIKKYGLDSFQDRNKAEAFREKLTETAPSDRPIIAIDPSLYDFGDVSRKEGTITTFLEIKNEGKSNLVIDRIETSCGCTSASIVYQEKEGPTFTMPGHDKKNSTEWQVSIPPGKTAKLKVYYDPNVHEDFLGQAVREIYVYSNDPIDFEKKVTIELNQIH
jgi:hypothetical protein